VSSSKIQFKSYSIEKNKSPGYQLPTLATICATRPSTRPTASSELAIKFTGSLVIPFWSSHHEGIKGDKGVPFSLSARTLNSKSTSTSIAPSNTIDTSKSNIYTYILIQYLEHKKDREYSNLYTNIRRTNLSRDYSTRSHSLRQPCRPPHQFHQTPSLSVAIPPVSQPFSTPSPSAPPFLHLSVIP